MSNPLGKCAILLVKLPEGAEMSRPWDLPEMIEGGQLYVRNIGLTTALGFQLAFNKRQLGLNCTDRQWAIVIRRGHMVYRPDEEHDLADVGPDPEYDLIDAQEAAEDARRLLNRWWPSRQQLRAAGHNGNGHAHAGEVISREMPPAAIAAKTLITTSSPADGTEAAP